LMMLSRSRGSFALCNRRARRALDQFVRSRELTLAFLSSRSLRKGGPAVRRPPPRAETSSE